MKCEWWDLKIDCMKHHKVVTLNHFLFDDKWPQLHANLWLVSGNKVSWQQIHGFCIRVLRKLFRCCQQTNHCQMVVLFIYIFRPSLNALSFSSLTVQAFSPSSLQSTMVCFHIFYIRRTILLEVWAIRQCHTYAAWGRHVELVTSGIQGIVQQAC